jgi:hypothetical protein
VGSDLLSDSILKTIRSQPKKGVYGKATKRVRQSGHTPVDMLSEGQYCKGEGSWLHQDMPGDYVS